MNRKININTQIIGPNKVQMYEEQKLNKEETETH